jgi:FMN phosphatase YigB (HAD superfamily)
VISEEIGVRKPDRAIFEALAARLGCPLEGWMVGDSLDMDVAGGSAAGLNTVWVTSDVSSAASPIQPTMNAPTVAEAVEAIAAAETL